MRCSFPPRVGARAADERARGHGVHMTSSNWRRKRSACYARIKIRVFFVSSIFRLNTRSLVHTARFDQQGRRCVGSMKYLHVHSLFCFSSLSSSAAKCRSTQPRFRCRPPLPPSPMAPSRFRWIRRGATFGPPTAGRDGRSRLSSPRGPAGWKGRGFPRRPPPPLMRCVYTI